MSAVDVAIDLLRQEQCLGRVDAAARFELVLILGGTLQHTLQLLELRGRSRT